MATTASSHCAIIGLFYPTLVLILRRKQQTGNQLRRHELKHAVTKELTSWIVCVSLAVLYCLCVVLLLQCMDVEANPGPSADSSNPAQLFDWHFAQLMQAFQTQTANLSRIMEENLGRLNHTINQLTSDIGRPQQCAQQSQEDVRDLHQDQDSITQRLGRLDKKADYAEMESKRRNLK